MDTKAYYDEIKSVQKQIEEQYGSVVHVTSIKNRDKNTTAGATFSCKPYNGARCIVDETHKVATKEEIKSFLELQERNRIENNRSEARKKKEVVVVMDRGSEMADGMSELVDEALELTTANSSSKKS